MTTAGKLAGFAAALAVLFGGGALAGEAIGPVRTGPGPAHGEDAAGGSDRRHGATPEEHPRPVRGLGVAEDGLRIVVPDPELRRRASETLRFRVVDRDGEVVRAFDVEHEKRMHLIVARRDLTGFRHLHPRRTADGSWSTTLRLDEAGSYRLFADFAHDGRPYTLATDLRVDGPADLKPLPGPAATAVSDGGDDVRLTAVRARAGEAAELRFAITRNGTTIRPEPYLGAGGHLVALREGDLAFLHVHPTEDGRDDPIGFGATFPTRGRYRLFLQFRHDGRVDTVAFTQAVE